MSRIIHRRTFLHRSLLASGGLILGDRFTHLTRETPLLRFGLVTDSHYADRPEAGTRYYRESLDKMRECIEEFNRHELDFIIHLGDFKDQNSEPDAVETLQFLQALEQVYNTFPGPRYHCIGNHDVDSITKQQFLQGVINTGITHERSYYQFMAGGVSCIVFDANYYADGRDQFYAEGANWQDIRIPEVEVQWLQDTLMTHKAPTLVFCHHPLFAYTHGEVIYHVQNYREVQHILEQSGQVLAVFQGHTHEERYEETGGIQYMTLLAMVDHSGPENNAYAIAGVYPDRIELTGFRRIKDKTMVVGH